MSDQTQQNIKYLEEELDRIEDEDSYDYTRVKAVIQDLQALKEENEKLKQLHDTSVKEEAAMLKEHKKLKEDYEKLDKHRDWVFKQYQLLVADTEKALKKVRKLEKANEELVNEKAIYRDYLAGNYGDGREDFIVNDIRDFYSDEFCESNDWRWCGLQDEFDAEVYDRTRESN